MQNNAKIIFLDVDGVLNCRETWEGPEKDGVFSLGSVLCDNLAHIVRETGAIVVLSSTWRIFWHEGVPLQSHRGTSKLERFLGTRGVTIHSCTRRAHAQEIRGDQINDWLQDHFYHFPDPRIVILDDDSDFHDAQKPFHVKTSLLLGGLTTERADKAIEILNSSLTYERKRV